MTGTEIMACHNATGVSFKTVAEFKAADFGNED